MSDIPTNNFFFYFSELVDKSVKLIEWNGIYSVAFISFSAVCVSVCLVSRTLVINYIYRYAPNCRPINKMILVEQVRASTYLTFNALFLLNLFYLDSFGYFLCLLFYSIDCVSSNWWDIGTNLWGEYL